MDSGGSALLPLPIDDISLDEEVQMIELLQRDGANIEELNTCRKAMSKLKNGGLARESKSSTVISLILSDIIGDPISSIASGPTFYSRNSCQAALSVFEKYNLLDKIPRSFSNYLQKKQNQEKIQENDSSKIVHNIIVGSNSIALEAGEKFSKTLNYNPFIVTNRLSGEASVIGKRLIELAYAIKNQSTFDSNNFNDIFSDTHTYNNFKSFVKQKKPLCVLLGGETTVNLRGMGKGGRCQEMALSAAIHSKKLFDEQKENILLLCAGSDGIDGPTDAAGGFAYSSMIGDDIKEAQNALENNDAYTYLSTTKPDDLIKIGHTATNVMDIIILLIQ
ncbi:unnamed protein product [Didymodactylos carnosus]|uniref:Glycerate kinase n=1 Tax=Didymodactylos carnosus TaxID=1234261 RepID=A0A8S2CUE9_9BILA|nr:unnamed protein product [Didymodactylos carnosus]CAF3508621.1 unnamed protein product [Didymodactylos carnosus]